MAKREPHKDEQLLMSELWDPALADCPRKWIQFVFPWGEAGTALENRKEANRWQIERHEEVGEFIRQQKIRKQQGQPYEMYHSAVSGGRGSGKTADDMMLLYWFFSTQLGGTVIATANNQDQLETRTWAELGVWHTMAINSHWFERKTLSLKPADWFKHELETQLKINCGYYYAVGQLWDADRPSAFAGVHNRYGLFVTFQEAVGIPKPIWTVTNGFFTDPTMHRYWLVSFNPRENSGPAFECFHKERRKWRGRKIDSRKVEHVDIKLCQEVIDTYGINSVEACAEVTGEFPGQSVMQFIGRDLVDAAATRTLPAEDLGAPYIIGVDVARFGNDQSVIQVRRGQNARDAYIPPIATAGNAIAIRGFDNVQVAAAVAEVANKLTAQSGQRPYINVDLGNGGGVYDVLKHRGFRVTGVDFGSAAEEPTKWRNRRTEMYARARQWMREMGCIENLDELKSDLAGPEYGYSGDNGTVILETKEHMADRGLASPDRGDAFVLTFAVRVARVDVKEYPSALQPASRVAAGVGDDYNPFDNS